MTATQTKQRRSQLPAATLAALALTFCLGCSPRGGAALKYETTPAARGAISEYVSASGTLSAVVSVNVGSQVSGKIGSLKVDFNSPVTKGELIAEIDPSIYVAAMRQAEGDLASAKADAILKQQNLARKRILAPQRAASQLDLDQATAELAQADAVVVIKTAALESARANLGYCKITSPVDGIVISRKVDVGQTVVAAMTTPVLFTIAQDISKMHISAAVSEADIGQVKSGLSVDFGVDAFPDEVFHGTVSQVRKAPTTISNVVTYETIIDVDNPERKLFPGMTADVSILVAQRDAALKIPNAALRYTPPENAVFEHAPPMNLEHSQRLAYALAGDATTLRPMVVRVGITDSVSTEVLDGLAEGTRLVTLTLSSGVNINAFSGPRPLPQ